MPSFRLLRVPPLLSFLSFWLGLGFSYQTFLGLFLVMLLRFFLFVDFPVGFGHE